MMFIEPTTAAPDSYDENISRRIADGLKYDLHMKDYMTSFNTFCGAYLEESKTVSLFDILVRLAAYGKVQAIISRSLPLRSGNCAVTVAASGNLKEDVYSWLPHHYSNPPIMNSVFTTAASVTKDLMTSENNNTSCGSADEYRLPSCFLERAVSRYTCSEREEEMKKMPFYNFNSFICVTVPTIMENIFEKEYHFLENDQWKDLMTGYNSNSSCRFAYMPPELLSICLEREWEKTNIYEEEYDHFLENEGKFFMTGFHSYSNSNCLYVMVMLSTVFHLTIEALIHTLMTKTNSALHLGSSRKQIQAMLDNVFTALRMDVMLSPFHSIPRNIAYEYSTNLRLRHRFRRTYKVWEPIQLLKKNHEIHISFGAEPYHPSDFNRVWFKPMQSDGGLSSRKNNHVLLLVATLNAIFTFTVGLHPPKIISNSIEYKEDYLSLTQSFILFNSIGFFISMAMIVLLLQKYPLKPWPTFSVLALLVCYVFSTMAIFPNQSLDMLLLASSFALFATAWMFKMGFCSR